VIGNKAIAGVELRAGVCAPLNDYRSQNTSSFILQRRGTCTGAVHHLAKRDMAEPIQGLLFLFQVGGATGMQNCKAGKLNAVQLIAPFIVLPKKA